MVWQNNLPCPERLTLVQIWIAERKGTEHTDALLSSISTAPAVRVWFLCSAGHSLCHGHIISVRSWTCFSTRLSIFHNNRYRVIRHDHKRTLYWTICSWGRVPVVLVIESDDEWWFWWLRILLWAVIVQVPFRLWICQRVLTLHSKVSLEGILNSLALTGSYGVAEEASQRPIDNLPLKYHWKLFA